MNQAYKKKSIFTLIIIVFIINYFTIQSKAQDDVTSYNTEAQEKLIESFTKIALAEKKGVDTTDQIIKINESINFYNNGQKYPINETNNTINNYKQSITISDEIINSNINDELSNYDNINQNLIMIKLLGTGIIIIISTISWSIFKRIYIKNELNSKIELT